MSKIGEVPSFMRLDAVAERLSVSVRTVRRLCERGELPGIVKIGSASCLPVDEIIRYVERQKGARS